MKKRVILGISTILGIIILLLVFFTAGIEKVIQSMENISYLKFILVAMLYLTAQTILFSRWYFILKTKVNFKIKKSKLFLIRTTGFAVSYLTPVAKVGGEPLMAYLMKKYLKIPYSKNIATIILAKLMDFTFGLFIVFIGLVYLFSNYSHMLSGVAAIIIISLYVIYVSILTLFYIRLVKRKNALNMFLRPFKSAIEKNKSLNKGLNNVTKEVFDFVKKNKKVFFYNILFTLIGQLLLLFVIKLIIFYLGLNVSFIQVLTIYSIAVFSHLLPTPGSLGTFEGAMAYGFYVIGLGASAGVATGLIQRSLDIMLVVIGLITLSYFGIKLLSPIVLGKDKNKK